MKNAKLYTKNTPGNHYSTQQIRSCDSPTKKPDDTSLPNFLAYSALAYSVTVRSHFALPAHFLPLGVGAS